MALVLVAGEWSDRSEYITGVIRAGYLVGWADPACAARPLTTERRPLGLICALDSGSDVEASASLARTLELPWLAWDCAAGASMEAYRMGAVAVLPADLLPADLAQAVSMLLDSAEAQDQSIGAGEVRDYHPPQAIPVGADSVVVVLSGIVATRALHPGGAQSLMGLFRSGDVLLAHPHESCHVELAAHSDTQVSVHRWQDVALTREYAHRVWRTQTYLTAWSSIQSRSRIDHRLLGLLMLLAERFGQPKGVGWVEIDLRLTYQQLAEAACASRPTVSKALREMQPTGVIAFSGAGDERRIRFRDDVAREMMAC